MLVAKATGDAAMSKGVQHEGMLGRHQKFFHHHKELHNVQKHMGYDDHEYLEMGMHHANHDDDRYKRRGVMKFDDAFGVLPDLHNVFHKACGTKDHMTKAVFLKLCEDAELVDEKCSLDWLYHLYRRVQSTAVAWIDLVGFENALHYIAKRKRTSAVKIYTQVYRMTVTRPQTKFTQGKLTKKGLSEVLFTERDLVPKMLCSVPPGTAPAWHAVPERLIREAEGTIKAKNTHAYELTSQQKQVAGKKRHQVESEKYHVRQAALRGEGPTDASFAIASAVTMWPEKVEKAVNALRASKHVFTPVGATRLPFELSTRPQAGATTRLGLCESCPDLPEGTERR